MMCVAAGLAASGKIAFASTFAMFAAGRAFEQVETQSAIQSLMLKLVLLTQAFLSVRTVRHINVLRTSL